jgi:hypothetical protein
MMSLIPEYKYLTEKRRNIYHNRKYQPTTNLCDGVLVCTCSANTQLNMSLSSPPTQLEANLKAPKANFEHAAKDINLVDNLRK